MLRVTRGSERTAAQSALLALIWLYQRFISPLFAGSCRFEPSCSQYARQAVILHGALKGSLLAFWRVSRCQPMCRCGYDPVPVCFSPNIPDTHTS